LFKKMWVLTVYCCIGALTVYIYYPRWDDSTYTIIQQEWYNLTG
jgi:hypothetical protein